MAIISVRVIEIATRANSIYKKITVCADSTGVRKLPYRNCSPIVFGLDCHGWIRWCLDSLFQTTICNLRLSKVGAAVQAVLWMIPECPCCCQWSFVSWGLLYLLLWRVRVFYFVHSWCIIWVSWFSLDCQILFASINPDHVINSQKMHIFKNKLQLINRRCI